MVSGPGPDLSPGPGPGLSHWPEVTAGLDKNAVKKLTEALAKGVATKRSEPSSEREQLFTHTGDEKRNQNVTPVNDINYAKEKGFFSSQIWRFAKSYFAWKRTQ